MLEMVSLAGKYSEAGKEFPLAFLDIYCVCGFFHTDFPQFSVILSKFDLCSIPKFILLLVSDMHKDGLRDLSPFLHIEVDNFYIGPFTWVVKLRYK